MDFIYIRELEKGAGARAEDFDSLFEGCRCVGLCTAANRCSCLFRQQDIYQDSKYIKAESVSLPVIECSSQCLCSLNSESCGNRCVQFGVTLPLEVFKTTNKGFGVRCSEPIRKGRFVTEYVGEVIGPLEVKRRSPHTVYTLIIKEQFHDREQTTYIDANKRGNIARFINHSCDPNLEMVIVRIGSPCVHVGLFASQFISPFEELSYDYGVNILRDGSHSQKLCLCASSNCHLYLPAS